MMLIVCLFAGGSYSLRPSATRFRDMDIDSVS